jgi:hypothetical protein
MDQTARQVRDEWLALRCKLRKPGAFAELEAELERPLLYYVTKLLGDENQAFDVLQETWVRAFRTILDVILTVIANGCYRWLARQLKGFDKAKPKQLYRKFVETGGQIEVRPNRRLPVTFDRRSHNPILREAALDRDCPPIPWLRNYHLDFDYR